jgi:RNA-directed DNA polymerase
MNTAARPLYAWPDLPWRTVERAVCTLQPRIYRASRRGKVTTVHTLQRLLRPSWSATLLATRRGTPDNRGRRSAGVDGGTSLPPPQRLRVAQTRSLCPKAHPGRRVWIPQSGTSECRP